MNIDPSLLQSVYELDFMGQTESLGKTLRGLKCPVHRKAVRVSCDYDRNEDVTEAEITKCCCKEFACQVAALIYRRGVPVVKLKKETGLTDRDVILEA